LRDTGDRLGIPVKWQDSAGVCDGNFLAAGGLPVIDTLGPWGWGMHSSEETVVVSSIETRVKLVVAFLGDFGYTSRAQKPT